jgi:uncharacterized protein (TIGR02145 family)
MKKTLHIFATGLLALLFNVTFAQAPQKFSYQSVIRNASNQLIGNQVIGLKVSILQGSPTGNSVFSELHAPVTNSNGLITIEIGGGLPLTGNISSIDWANGPFFIQTETDIDGGNNYTITATSQLMSVPYALYALNSGSSIPGPQGEQGPIGQTGPSGPQGEQGPIGLTGPAGSQGLTGAQGSQGPIGLTGATGPQGLTGAIGPQGEQGSIGLTGPAGPQGPTGLNGTTGAVGPQGLTGAIGPQGPIGLTGPAGATGVNGSNGKNSLVKTTNEPAGATCETGGVKMEYGIDANSNGTLDLSEVNNALTKYVCNGLQGEPATDDQQLSVSQLGDTLFLAGGGFIIMPGISGANGVNGQSGVTNHTCGAPLVHNPVLTYNTVTDIDGNIYKTINIGNQNWMAENLKVTHYNNGDIIPEIDENSTWFSLNSGACSGDWNSIKYIPVNECPFGKFYNGFVVSDYRNACPVGWHVPTESNWIELFTYLGGINVSAFKLKARGTYYWTQATESSVYNNSSGFSALAENASSANYWISNVMNEPTLKAIVLGNTGNVGISEGVEKNLGLSIRCIMD